MRLLFVGYLHGFGGAEKQLIMLANQMVKRGHDVYLVSLAQSHPCYPIDKRVRYSYQNDKYSRKTRNILDQFRFLKHTVEEINPDLVINFNVQSAFFCVLMGNGISNKTIYSERGDPYDKEYAGLNGKIRNYMIRHAAGFVFQTKGARDFFGSKVARKSIVTNNPIFINPDNYSGLHVTDKRIVTVGRLHPQKNQELFIKALSLLPTQFSDYSAEVYGDGELKGQLQEQIDGTQSNVCIKLMGAHKDIIDRITGAAVFVLTSDYEGMPNALMEAMALGIPCISTDCRPGGARELIEDDVNGYIVPCGNAEAIANRIIAILTDPQKTASMVVAGRKRVKCLSPEIIYDKWESFFIQKSSKESR